MRTSSGMSERSHGVNARPLLTIESVVSTEAFSKAFKPLDLLTDSALSQMQLARGTANASGLGDRKESTQQNEIDSAKRGHNGTPIQLLMPPL